MNEPDPDRAIDIKIPVDADPAEVAECLIAVLSALICSVSETRREARDRAKDVGKDVLAAVSELWDGDALEAGLH